MNKYLFRVLGEEESKKNRIKNIIRREYSLFDYLTQNNYYRDCVISMACLLDVSLGYIREIGDPKKHRIAVIDRTKLDSRYLVDVSSISKLAATRLLNQGGKLPPEALDNSRKENCLHFSSCNLEFVYEEDIPEEAYQVFSVEDLEWIYVCVYDPVKINDNSYPLIVGEPVYFDRSKIRELRPLSLMNGDSKYNIFSIYIHSLAMMKYGILDNMEELLDSLFYHVDDSYLPGENEIKLLSDYVMRVKATKSYELRKNIEKILVKLIEGGLNLKLAKDMYGTMPKSNLYLNGYRFFTDKKRFER